MSKNRLLIAGSRTIKHNIDHILDNASYIFDVPFDEVIEGEAPGVDTLGKHWAINKGYEVIPMPADWDTYGKRAGFLRNLAMNKACTHAIVVWDGASRGAEMMIDILEQSVTPHVVVKLYETN